ncbi:MAG TPA: methyltransferase type 11, partial [Planctomycetota bacterium]|nr:methyltransferase type 11 [Planctomycetota bacterium]
ALVDEYRLFYGPTMSAFEAAEKNGKAEELRKELVALFEAHNQSAPGKGTSYAAAFLRVTVEC